MQAPLPSAPGTEPAAALLQAAITAALAALCAFLYRRYRKPYLAWWALAWGLYVVRIAAILSFLATDARVWLFWHQVLTGWTALAILGAALVFSQRLRRRRAYFALFLFPPLWSYVAIYRLHEFLWAAGPAVLFLSLATLWTGGVFSRYRRRVGAASAALLAGAFYLWGLHHLDYPFLRARGAWNPWGYYLDIVFELAVGAGIVLLVLDEVQRGLAALSALSGDLQRSGRQHEVLDALLGRPLTLPAVRGSALWLPDDGGRWAGGAGVCAEWPGTTPTGAAATTLAQATATGRPQVTAEWGGHAYAAALPIARGEAVVGVLVLVGDARDPFTALDDGFLVALGQQVGAALAQADLRRRLEVRTAELERLSTLMMRQHEEERRRLSRELHDETAQVFSAVKMELGLLRERLGDGQGERLDHALALVDTGIRSIRAVVNDLRPSLLDDLGLLPALRSLVSEFGERSGVATTLAAPCALPPLSKEAELALFRALQEALANVVRHAGARRVEIALAAADAELRLVVADDGRGFPQGAADVEAYERAGHMGLAGMRERLGALGGAVRLGAAPSGGVQVELRLPLPAAESAA